MSLRPSASILWALGAILLWGTLAAAIGDALEGVPPNVLVLAAFVFAAPVLVAVDLARGRSLRAIFGAPPPVWALGLVGIFGYHVLLFQALARAPLIEANLLNDLWPLLMVALAWPLAGERPTRRLVAGAVLGAVGAALVVTQGKAPALSREHATGYGLALAAAVTWAVFSVLLRRLGPAGENRMALFAVIAVAASVALTAATGELGLPRGRALAASAWLGAGPMGIAVLFWSKALATGSAARIGVLSNLTPLLATLAVCLHLGKPVTPWTGVGLVLIVTGATLPSLGGPKPGLTSS